METSRTLIIRNDIDELNRMVAFLETLEGEGLLPVALVGPINLVLEEALSNVIFYAYETQGNEEIQIDFLFEENQLKITISDGGKAFDPTLEIDPDISLGVEDRPIGGLGIYLIRKLMDEVKYARVEEKNVLSLVKRL